MTLVRFSVEPCFAWLCKKFAQFLLFRVCEIIGRVYAKKRACRFAKLIFGCSIFCCRVSEQSSTGSFTSRGDKTLVFQGWPCCFSVWTSSVVFNGKVWVRVFLARTQLEQFWKSGLNWLQRNHKLDCRLWQNNTINRQVLISGPVSTLEIVNKL